MNLVDKVLGVVEKGMVLAVYVLVGLMVVNTSLGVFTRFVLNNALSWTDELGRYMMIWVGFFGCALATKEGSHVGVEMFVELFKPGIKRILQVAARLVVTTFLVVILYQAQGQLSLLKIQRSPALEIPMGIPYSAVIFGVFMMLIENLAHIFRLVKAPLAAKAEK
jgi:TRAP-type C4-dicarboxylate transport system permease small subunit